MTDPDVEQREVKALIEASNELSSSGGKAPNLAVLTWNEKREITKDKKTIYFKPLWEWLLS